MVVFTRKAILQRILKKRRFKKNKNPVLKYGTTGIYCLHTFRFEYRYCLFVRKLFKKLFKRRRRKIPGHYRRKAWLFIRPNYVLTHKSKNARMGKGKGNFKRWCTIVYPGKVFIEHVNIPPRLYKQYILKLQRKLKLKFELLNAAQSITKHCIINNGLNVGIDTLELYQVRKSLLTNHMFVFNMGK